MIYVYTLLLILCIYRFYKCPHIFCFFSLHDWEEGYFDYGNMKTLQSLKCKRPGCTAYYLKGCGNSWYKIDNFRR